MEVLGSGMVHPRVIANCGLNPDEWQGFAFGTGVDRLAMLKYGMLDASAAACEHDRRVGLSSARLRWLAQRESEHHEAEGIN